MKSTDSKRFWSAAKDGDLKTIDSLIASADRAALDSALIQSVVWGRTAAVERLLKHGANPEQNAGSRTLLMAAAEGDVAIVKHLVEAGADVHREVRKQTALSAALVANQVEVIEYLESLGARLEPDLRLIYAAQNGDLERVKRALADGANLEATTGSPQQTALMAAAGNDHLEMTLFLIQKGAKVTANVEGRTAVHHAAAWGKKAEPIEALIAAGGNVNDTWHGNTALMAATNRGHLPILKKLVELGADIQMKDEQSRTVLDHANGRGNTEIIAYIKSLGVARGREDSRRLAAALAREFGGKVIEHTHGFMLDTKFGGWKSQMHVEPDGCSVDVRGLHYADASLRGLQGELKVTAPKPEAHAHKTAEPTDLSTTGEISEALVAGFRARYDDRLRELGLEKDESLTLGSKGACFKWSETNFDLVRPRLKKFADFLTGISGPPPVERRLFEKEWLLRPVTKRDQKQAARRHSFGGKLEHPIRCPHCGQTTNQMATIDLSDPLLSKTPLAGRKIPIFWCLTCLEWDPAFFDLSGKVPKPILDPEQETKDFKSAPGEGEQDAAERPLELIPVAAGKKAGRKSKIGGAPNWIQLEAVPDCPKCQKSMAFLLQLASDSRMAYADDGLLYAFACPECQISASLIQSH